MRLHSVRVLGLGQDLEQLVVRQEVESREARALRFQSSIVRHEGVLSPRYGGAGERTRLVVRESHDALPGRVDCLEDTILVRQLALDVRRREDALQIHPALLAQEPLVQRVLHQNKAAAHVFHRVSDPRHVSGPKDGADRHQGIVQVGANFADVAENEDILGLFVVLDLEIGRRPDVLDFAHHALQHCLLLRRRRDGGDLLVELRDLSFDQISEREGWPVGLR
eukprot:scaffold2724_cov260-Pinguiococcus_pyrenoidosus.AAC.21